MNLSDANRVRLEHIRHAVDRHREATAELRAEGISGPALMSAALMHAINLHVAGGAIDDERFLEHVATMLRAARDPREIPIGTSGLA